MMESCVVPGAEREMVSPIGHEHHRTRGLSVLLITSRALTACPHGSTRGNEHYWTEWLVV